MDNMSIEDIVNILSRKTIDGEAVNKTLVSASVKNFRTLYDIQLDLVGMKRYDISINDLDRVYKLSSDEENQHYPHRYVYRVPYSVISSNSRRLCKVNGYYGVALSQETISANPSAFDFNFFIFIDGNFIDTGELRITDAESMFILDVSAGEDTLLTDGIPMEDYKRYCEEDALVTFMIIPNFNMGKADFNITTFNDVLRRNVDYRRFDNATNFNQDKTMFFLNTENRDQSTKEGVYCYIDQENRYVSVPEDIPVTQTRLSFVGITLDDVYERMDVYPGQSNWFQLPENYTAPLPVENILAFNRTSMNTFTFNNKISFTLFYPNIYRIDNWDGDSELVLYIMYKETNDAKYHNDLELLKLLSGNLASRYEADSLPEFVKDYEPQDISWMNSLYDFKDSIYFPTKSLYNINALSQIVLRNPHFLIEYAYLKLKASPKYYINVNKLSLPERMRFDTYMECQDAGDIIYFNSPRYIFSLRKKFVGSFGTDFRVFVDNKFLSPFEYTFLPTMDYYHFYIPCDKIHPDSIIELEKYTEFEFTRPITFTSIDEPIQIDLPKNVKKLYTRNISLLYEANKLYISPTQYKILAYSDIMEEEITLQTEGSATIKNYFKIVLLDERYVNVPLKVIVNHRIVTETVTITDEQFNNLPVSVPIVNNSNLTSDRVRVFTSGLLLPNTLYQVTTDHAYMGHTSVDLYIDVTLDIDRYRNLTIDELPIGQVCEYRQAYIENEYGFVDTGNLLSLPLDLKWYDIYVNGMKLNKSNVDIITSSKFFIKNVESRKNLYIYARTDIYDEFDILHNETAENKLFDNIDEIYEELLRDRDIVQDTLDDIMGDLLENIAEHMEFVRDILEYTYINANTQQITEEIRMLYPDLIDEYGILWLDSNTNTDAGRVTMIDSNVRSDYMKNDQYRYGWSPLYIGSHDDARAGEYLCDPITGAPGMKDHDGSVIPIGELDRLTIHKSNLLNSLVNLNLSSLDIYQLQFEENTTSKDVTSGDNILDDEVTLEQSVSSMVLSLDIQVLTKGYKDVMQYSSYVPNVEITYQLSGTMEEIVKVIPYNVLADTSISIKNSGGFTLKSICIKPVNDTDDMSNIKCVLHSILIAV